MGKTVWKKWKNLISYIISYVAYVLCILYLRYPISYVSYITSYLLLAGCTRWGKQFGRNGRSDTLSSSKSPNTLSPSAGDFIVIVIVIVIVISPRPSLPIHFCHLQVLSYFATFATFCLLYQILVFLSLCILFWFKSHNTHFQLQGEEVRPTGHATVGRLHC